MSAEVNDAVKIEIDYEDKKCLLFLESLKYVASVAINLPIEIYF